MSGEKKAMDPELEAELKALEEELSEGLAEFEKVSAKKAAVKNVIPQTWKKQMLAFCDRHKGERFITSFQTNFKYLIDQLENGKIFYKKDVGYLFNHFLKAVRERYPKETILHLKSTELIVNRINQALAAMSKVTVTKDIESVETVTVSKETEETKAQIYKASMEKEEQNVEKYRAYKDMEEESVTRSFEPVYKELEKSVSELENLGDAVVQGLERAQEVVEENAEKAKAVLSRSKKIPKTAEASKKEIHVQAQAAVMEIEEIKTEVKTAIKTQTQDWSSWFSQAVSATVTVMSDTVNVMEKAADAVAVTANQVADKLNSPKNVREIDVAEKLVEKNSQTQVNGLQEKAAEVATEVFKKKSYGQLRDSYLNKDFSERIGPPAKPTVVSQPKVMPKAVISKPVAPKAAIPESAVSPAVSAVKKPKAHIENMRENNKILKNYFKQQIKKQAGIKEINQIAEIAMKYLDVENDRVRISREMKLGEILMDLKKSESPDDYFDKRLPELYNWIDQCYDPRSKDKSKADAFKSELKKVIKDFDNRWIEDLDDYAAELEEYQEIKFAAPIPEPKLAPKPEPKPEVVEDDFDVFDKVEEPEALEPRRARGKVVSHPRKPLPALPRKSDLEIKDNTEKMRELMAQEKQLKSEITKMADKFFNLFHKERDAIAQRMDLKPEVMRERYGQYRQLDNKRQKMILLLKLSPNLKKHEIIKKYFEDLEEIEKLKEDLKSENFNSVDIEKRINKLYEKIILEDNAREFSYSFIQKFSEWRAIKNGLAAEKEASPAKRISNLSEAVESLKEDKKRQEQELNAMRAKFVQDLENKFEKNEEHVKGEDTYFAVYVLIDALDDIRRADKLPQVSQLKLVTEKDWKDINRSGIVSKSDVEIHFQKVRSRQRTILKTEESIQSKEAELGQLKEKSIALMGRPRATLKEPPKPR